jgi:hypothetical protein
LKRLLSGLRARLTRADEILAKLQTLQNQQIELGVALRRQADALATLAAEGALRQEGIQRELRSTEEGTAEIRHQLGEMAQVQQAMRSQLLKSRTALERATLNRLSRMEKAIEADTSVEAASLAPMLLPRRLSVHFLFQMPEIWTTWESVWQACVRSEQIEPTIVLLPFNHGSAGDPGRARRFLAGQGLPFVDISGYRLEDEQPDVVFLQNPYDSTRPDNVSVERLRAQGARIAYIPYGLDVGGGTDNLRWQYDLEVQRQAWRIFVRSEEHRRMYGLHCQSGNRHVVVTGHPKVDRIVTHCRSPKDASSQPEGGGGLKTVLWCPHFTVEPGGWSTFVKLSESILSYFESEPEGLRLIVRPHPLFFGRLKEVMADASAVEETLRRRFDRNPHMILDEGEEYASSFLESDALMTDAGSFLLEYLPTEKPILYLHNSDGPGLNESGDFVEFYYQAMNFPDVTNFLKMVRAGADPKREARIEQTKRLLHCTDGSVGAHIATLIVENFPLQRYVSLFDES